MEGKRKTPTANRTQCNYAKVQLKRLASMTTRLSQPVKKPRIATTPRCSTLKAVEAFEPGLNRLPKRWTVGSANLTALLGHDGQSDQLAVDLQRGSVVCGHSSLGSQDLSGPKTDLKIACLKSVAKSRLYMAYRRA
jgi:hypothetical protein